MKQELVSTFLAVAETRNLVKAAEQLYVSQGAISMRIKQLEDELGVSLLLRGRGLKSIELTQQGYAFLTIARQWQNLEEQALQIKHQQDYLQLNIVANDMINTQILTDFYKQFATEHTDVMLNIDTSSPSNAYRFVENQTCHIGISTSLYSYDSVKTTPLYHEPMVFVADPSHPFFTAQDKKVLQWDKEVYVPWNHEYAIWHDAYTQKNKRHFIILHTATMSLMFIDQKDQWMIAPLSVAKLMSRDRHLHYCEVPEYPNRTIYLIEPKIIPAHYKAITLSFKNELLEWLAQR